MRAEIARAMRSASLDGDVLRAEFLFPPDSPVFAGHFPGRPILPAFLEVEVIRVAAEMGLSRAFAIRSLRNAKFLHAILPDEVILLEAAVAQADGETRLKATLTVAGREVARMNVVLVDATAS